MHQHDKMTHYRQYYQYRNMDEETARITVNQLFPKIRKNDQSAFETALRIIREQAYFNICKRVSGSRFDTLDFVDDIMQSASLEYARKSMSGFHTVSHDNFYAYSLKIFQLCTTHYISRYNDKVMKKEILFDERQETQDAHPNCRMENMAPEHNGIQADSPEQIFLDGQQESCRQECIACYIQMLEESKIVPYKLITYCYACILPAILKDHRKNSRLLKWINRLNIPGQEKSSWADETTGEIGGLIARESDYLLKWAVTAMHKKNVADLSDEFTQIYNIRPMTDSAFSWGDAYRSNLRKADDTSGRFIQEVGKAVVTEEFPESAMKNWPQRVSVALMKEAAAKIMENPQLRDFAVEYAQQRISKKKCTIFVKL